MDVRTDLITGTGTGHLSDSRSGPRPELAEELGSLVIAVAGVWTAVVAISALAPDMVSGSEQQHMPVAAFGTWFWGVVATWAVLGVWATLRRSPARRHLHRPLALGVAGVWWLAAAVSVLAPVVETGSDPTRIPVAALVGPVVATVVNAAARAGLDVVGRLLDEDVDAGGDRAWARGVGSDVARGVDSDPGVWPASMGR